MAPTTILVPLDGSALAEAAVPVACSLARRAGHAVRLVHVHKALTAEPIHVEGLPVIDEHLHSRRRDHERAYLDHACARWVQGVPCATDLLEEPVASALARHAETIGAELIVMTTHGRGGLERAWLGSVADELARLAPVPLLLLRPEPGQAPPTTFPRILVALDGSTHSESILPHAVRIARLDPAAEILLLEVVEPRSGAGPAETAAAQEAEAAEGLARLVARLQGEGVRARSRVVAGGGRVARAILEVADEERSGVIALATHGRSGLARAALGSVADKVVRASHLPVLLHRPRPGA